MNPVITSALLCLVWLSAFSDFRSRRIPNRLIVLAVLFGSTLQLLYGGMVGLGAAAGGLTVGMLLLLPGYLLGMTGAADVKLMAAAGVFLGAGQALLAGLASLAAGALIGLGFVLAALCSPAAVGPRERYSLMWKTLITTGRPVYLAPVDGELMARRFPFGVAIALGVSGSVGWRLLQLA